MKIKYALIHLIPLGAMIFTISWAIAYLTGNVHTPNYPLALAGLIGLLMMCVGAITIGVIAHSNSVISGHGPGVTTVLTSPKGMIEPFIDPDANLINYLY